MLCNIKYKLLQRFTLISCFLFYFSSPCFSQSITIDSLLSQVKTGKEDSIKAYNLAKLSWKYYEIGEAELALKYANLAIELATRINFKTGIAEAYNNMGAINVNQGNYVAAKDYFLKSVKVNEELKNKPDVAKILGNIGIVCKLQGDYAGALEYHLKALRIGEESNDKIRMATSLLNVGIVYFDMKDHEKAMEYNLKALKLNEEIGDREGVSDVYNNMANIFTEEKKYNEAFEYYLKSLEIIREIGDEGGVSITLSNIGQVAQEQGNFDKALEYYQESLKIDEKLGDQYGIALGLRNIGSVYADQKKYKMAETHLLKSIALSTEIGALDAEMAAHESLSKMYFSLSNFEKAYWYLMNYYEVKDSIFNIEKENDITRKQMNYEFEKKEAATNAEHEKQLAIAEVEKKRQRLFLGMVLAVAIGIGFIATIIFLSLRTVRKQKKEIEHQKHLVEEHQKDMVDSITYAKRIQDAILPPFEFIKKEFPNSFVMYKPKDIVAGDFYWMEKLGNTIFIAAADCTGHGVPGAMVSVVCSNALNRAVKEFDLKDTGKILDKVTDLVLETFEKSSSDVKDGMDISLLSFKLASNGKSVEEIQWSGANNPLWYIRDEAVFKIKPDKQPIGKHDHRKQFTTHKINVKENTTFYLFTDGFPDQFGGPNGKKFLYKQLEENLFSVYQLPMNEQKIKLEIAFNTWKNKTEQIDDVTLMGIKI